MDNFLLVSTKRTPEIILMTNGMLMIKGTSHPADVTVFYKPVYEWLAQFKEQLPAEVSFTLDLDYIDTPSTRNILELIKVVSALKSDKTKVKIIWKYEYDDHDMLDQGKIFETKTNYPFEFIEKTI